MYANQEILVFDGTIQGLRDQLELLLSAMPKGVAFVNDRNGVNLNRVRVNLERLTDGSYVWDIDLIGKD